MARRSAANAAIALLFLLLLLVSPSHAAIAAATTTPAMASSARKRPHRVRNESARTGYLTAASIAQMRDESLRSFDRRCVHPDPEKRFPPPDLVEDGIRRWKVSTVRAYHKRREEATKAEAGIKSPADRLKAWKAGQTKRRPTLVAAE
jgi:hypothetical protein